MTRERMCEWMIVASLCIAFCLTFYAWLEG